MTNVTVLDPKSNAKIEATRINGVIVINKNKPAYGSIAVGKKTMSMNGGFLQKENRVAFINGKVEDLKEFVEMQSLAAGSTMQGKIQIIESTTPASQNMEPKINPTTKEVITSGGEAVYRQSIYTTDVNAQDTLLPTDKVESEVSIANKQAMANVIE